MRSIPLSLETYYFDESWVKAVAGYRVADAPSNLLPAILCMPRVETHAEDPARIRVVIDLEVNSLDGVVVPYEVRLRLVGFFRIEDPDLHADAQAQLAHSAAVSILFSAARDHLYTLTAKGPNEPLLLPPVHIPAPDDRTAAVWGERAAPQG
ncbi:MAG: hypothetical protein RID91_10195 [Azospirillaceae bacterium]